MAQYLVESPSFLGQEAQKVRISWFVKEIQSDIYNNKPFYGHFLEGGSTVGRLVRYISECSLFIFLFVCLR